MTMLTIDHLVFAAPELKSACDHVEDLTGVKPQFGGVHGHGLSHNALLSLGENVYLEIYAPTPNARRDSPGADDWIEHCLSLDAPELMTFCMSTPTDMTELAAQTRKLGLNAEGPAAWSRATPDGQKLEWQLFEPIAPQFNFTVPFFINWGETPHPSANSPKGCKLKNLRISSTKSHDLSAVFDALKISDIDIQASEKDGLSASIQTPLGLIELT